MHACDAPAPDDSELARLRARARELQALAESALAESEFSALIDRAVATVARALAVEIVAIDESQPDGDRLVRGSTGLGADATERVRAGPTTAASVLIGPPERPWGVLIAAAKQPRTFADDDVEFLQSVSNVLAMAWQRGQAERALRLSEQLFRGGFEHSPIGMALSDTDETLSRVNRAFARMLGYQRPEDLVGVSMAALTHPDDLAEQREAARGMLEDGVPYTGERRLLRADGELVHALVGSTPVRDPRGEAPVFFSQVKDITDAKRAEALVRESQSRLQSIVDHAPAAIYLTDLDGRFMLVNGEAERILGIPRERTLGRLREDVLPAEIAGRRRAMELEVLRRGRPVAFEGIVALADGDHTYLSVRFPLRDEHGRIYAIGGISSDITEQKAAQRELARLAAAAEYGTDAVVTVDLDRRVRKWNRGAERLYGYRAEEVIGRSVGELNALGGEPEAADARAQDALERMRRGEPAFQQEIQRRRKDGGIVDVLSSITPWRVGGRLAGVTATSVDITARKQAEQAAAWLAAIVESSDDAIIGKTLDGRITSWNPAAERIYGYRAAEAVGKHVSMLIPPGLEDELDELLEAVAGGETVRNLETARVHKDGRVIDVSLTVTPIRNRDGQLAGAATVARDITGHKRAERERLELLEATTRAESANRAKSEFLARMSHELRTPLNSIVGFSQLVELEGLGPRQSEHVGYVLKAAGHLLEMIDEVLELARIEAGRLTISPEPVALVDTIREALALVAPLARQRAVTLDAELEIARDGPAQDTYVHADRHRLQQVFLNVLSNAIKYNRSGGRVHVSFVAAPSGRVRLAIADTGIGIQRDQLAKLFEPFERLGAEFSDVEGTGLGLSLSKGLLEAMGATIEASSQPGAGTTFTIELAAARAPHRELERRHDDRRAASPRIDAAERQVILYVEDNLSNLTLVERILERQSGVELIPAMQGTIGLELAREHRPALIVLDLHLPDMSGAEVLARLKAHRLTREIPVVVLTADASKGQSDHLKSLGAAEYLTKPLDVRRFLEVIADNLALRSRQHPGPPS